jgi:hypothetical protein
LPPADGRINLPYAFWNETFGFAAGYVYAINGFPQPQAGMVASVMAGTEGSVMGFLMGHNIRPFASGSCPRSSSTAAAGRWRYPGTSRNCTPT